MKFVRNRSGPDVNFDDIPWVDNPKREDAGVAIFVCGILSESHI